MPGGGGEGGERRGRWELVIRGGREGEEGRIPRKSVAGSFP